MGDIRMTKDRIEWLKSQIAKYEETMKTAQHPEFLEHAIKCYQEILQKEQSQNERD